jgi:hypothetical protein
VPEPRRQLPFAIERRARLFELAAQTLDGFELRGQRITLGDGFLGPILRRLESAHPLRVDREPFVDGGVHSLDRLLRRVEREPELADPRRLSAERLGIPPSALGVRPLDIELRHARAFAADNAAVWRCDAASNSRVA